VSFEIVYGVGGGWWLVVGGWLVGGGRSPLFGVSVPPNEKKQPTTNRILRLVDRSFVRSFVCLVCGHSLVGWLVGWSVGWLVGRLVGWLVLSFFRSFARPLRLLEYDTQKHRHSQHSNTQTLQ